MSRDAFAVAYDVPRGTMAKFDRYAALLTEWQTKMNLVAASTLATIWDRHFADSAQLAALRGDNEARVWLDLGSGAGFPALVIALLVPGEFHLVDATAKKCSFLAAVTEALDLSGQVTIHNTRIEAMPPLAADTITARACASLTRLFDLGAAHGRSARWLLPKGRSVADEILAAQQDYDFDYELIASRTDPDARIVAAHHVRRRLR